MVKNTLKSLGSLVTTFDNVMVILATILIIWLAYIIPQNFDFLDPVGQALGDVDLTDMVFSQFRSDEQRLVDTSVVLVNIGNASRDEIAQILERINLYDPLVVGVDVFFKGLKDSLSDARLADALSNTHNLVMVSKVAFKADLESEAATTDSANASVHAFDTLLTSNAMFTANATTGFANLVIDQDAAFMTCRDISIRDSCAGRIEPCFALQIVSLINPKAAEYAVSRGNETEVINFHGNLTAFYHVDLYQALDPDIPLDIVRNKVVLLGYMGNSFGDGTTEDKFFTPLNNHYVGRSFPDMHGVVVHANVIGMLNNKSYINTMPQWLSVLVGFLVLVCNVVFLNWVYVRAEKWYDMIAVACQLLQSVAMLFLIVFVFDAYQYKLALTPALFVVFLVGTVHDLYQDSLKKIVLSIIDKAKSRRKSASSQRLVRSGQEL